MRRLRTLSIIQSLYVLLTTFIVGIACLIATHLFFAHMFESLDREISNEKVRYQIGEYIVDEINEIESMFYQIASISNAKAAEYKGKEIIINVNDIRNAIDVLEKGGVIERKIALNIAGRDDITQQLKYYRTNNKAYTLESIDLMPRLAKLETKLQELITLEIAYSNELERGQTKEALKSHEELHIFLKLTGSMFSRMKENASRLLYESRINVAVLEKEVQNKKDYYTLIEISIIAIILAHIIAVSILMAMQIKRANKTLEQTANDAATAAEQARLASEAKSKFLANMSHEIRTPLNAMIGFIDIMSDNESDEQKKGYIQTVKKSAHSLLGIINDILDISKIESGKLEIENINYRPLNELRDIISLFYEKAKEKNITFETDIDKNMPNILKGDPLRMKQILFNLLSNAIKFTNENGTILFTVSVDYNNKKILYSVQDSGIGIASGNLNKVFDSFSQEDSSTTRKYGGTGLGLSISKKLTQMMGGDLMVESEKGVGAKFYFSVPLVIGDDDAFTKSKEASAPQGFKGRILLVEDIETNRKLMKIILNKMGLDVETANDGLEAIDRFNSDKFDLILMDENMPNLNGIEATKRILEIESVQNLVHTPIVALTANALKGDRERFLEAGMDEYMTKPVDRKVLEAIFTRFLQT